MSHINIVRKQLFKKVDRNAMRGKICNSLFQRAGVLVRTGKGLQFPPLSFAKGDGSTVKAKRKN